jgi:hypothetical protein
VLPIHSLASVALDGVPAWQDGQALGDAAYEQDGGLHFDLAGGQHRLDLGFTCP